MRSLTAGEPRGECDVVLMAGLGAPGYLLPWAIAIADWTRATVLDLPGWRRGRARGCAPTVPDVATATARWLEVTERRRVILVGHSTGAQAMARTALLVPDRLAALVLAGPTFDPAVRNGRSLIRATLTTLAHERLAEVPAVLPSYLRSGGFPLIRMIRSGLADRIEDHLAQVRVPVLILTGEHDGYAPPAWARRLGQLASARCVVMPGSHNFCFPHPEASSSLLQAWAQEWAG